MSEFPTHIYFLFDPVEIQFRIFVYFLSNFILKIYSIKYTISSELNFLRFFFAVSNTNPILGSLLKCQIWRHMITFIRLRPVIFAELIHKECPYMPANFLVSSVEHSEILYTKGVKCMIFNLGVICSPRILQSTEGKNYTLPMCIYYFCSTQRF
jgi:hypothetical protein